MQAIIRYRWEIWLLFLAPAIVTTVIALGDVSWRIVVWFVLLIAPYPWVRRREGILRILWKIEIFLTLVWHFSIYLPTLTGWDFWLFGFWIKGVSIHTSVGSLVSVLIVIWFAWRATSYSISHGFLVLAASYAAIDFMLMLHEPDGISIGIFAVIMILLNSLIFYALVGVEKGPAFRYKMAALIFLFNIVHFPILAVMILERFRNVLALLFMIQPTIIIAIQASAVYVLYRATRRLWDRSP